ncbi:MAG: AarF/ABC1/UbiB kinase family protein, partial [Desulfobacterales bacterium]|nr:AarF/ABC1/UbiB kinase family protein [Desulfobacterales bacterium]
MKLKSLPQFTRNAKRFSEIVSILGKYGLAYWITEQNPDFIKDLFKSSDGLRLSEMTQDARIRMAMTELGATFIKLGQMMSTRADLVGPSLAGELAELQSDTPADPPEVVRRTVESELGKPPEALFAEFDDRAMASASIGQVHLATLQDGQAVVVKVQHEGVEETVINDLDILVALAELAEKHDADLRPYQPYAMALDFRRSLLRELDFARETRNLKEFKKNFEKDETVHIPEPYPELSARRVLTMEKLDGFSVADTGRLLQEGVDTKEIARRGAAVTLNMIFRDGFYHADPHPGNIFVLSGSVIGLLDCGMVGRIDDQTREEFENALLAAAESDAGQVMSFVIRMGSAPQDLDRDALRAEIGEFLAEYVSQSLKDFDLSGALTSLTDIIRGRHIILPTRVSMLIKVLVMLEGTSRQLDRDFNLAEMLQPYFASAIQRRLSPNRILNKLKRSYQDWERLIDALP